MVSLTKYAGTISQSTGGNYRTFSDLSNLKNNVEGSWANSNGNIKGKSSSPNRPSTLSLTNFAFNLPTGAEVSKVTVYYRHKKTGSLNIGSPTVSLLGVSGKSGKGVAPTTSMVTSSKSFTGLTRTQVNSSSFGVKIDYPANSNSSEGTLSVSYVRITVEYKVPSYALTLKKVSGGYNEESYIVEASISNTNLTSYNPSVTLTAPTGFSFTDFNGTGEYTVVSPTTISWNPKFTSKVASSTALFKFDVDVTYPSGQSSYTGNFTLSESLYSSSKSLSATITDRPSGEGTDVDPDEPLPDEGTASVTEDIVINVLKGNDFILNLDEIVGTDYTNLDYLFISFFKMNGNNISYDSTYHNKGAWGSDYYYTFYPENMPVEGYWNITKPSYYKVRYEIVTTQSSNTSTRYGYFYVNVIPEETDLTTPFFTVLEPSEEEYNRLGSGYTYIAQSDIKHTTTDTNSRDWYKNNRIGVFNGPVTNNTTEEDIFTNAQYWSKATGGLNEYNNCECEFEYDSQYPLYILMTGDYPEATTYGYDIGTIKYDTPCIIEKQVYNGREKNGTYPVPIEALLDGEDIATLQLAKDQTSQGVVLYDFPVDETISTNDKLAIRGLQVRANIEATDNLVIQAKLHSPTGEVGNRSILVDSQDEEIVIGGLGDLWGFTTLQMTNLELWQLELSVANILSQSDSRILFNNVEIIFYLETVEKQEITIKIEKENLAYYGATITDINVQEGLETDTSFLDIDGTDTNDIYRQDIREKEITIEFNIHTCDIKTSTDMLRQITKLIINKRDKYNRPIPKTIEISNRPEDYYEYVILKPFSTEQKITGYSVKATLTIPAGTSYSLEDTVTNTSGTVNGLAAINPIILLRPSDNNIKISEGNSGQAFNMTYGGDWNTKLVMIDCENRRAYLMSSLDDDSPIDISGNVDANADWFRLYGEFDFSSLNCTILSVTFNERW